MQAEPYVKNGSSATESQRPKKRSRSSKVEASDDEPLGAVDERHDDERTDGEDLGGSEAEAGPSRPRALSTSSATSSHKPLKKKSKKTNSKKVLTPGIVYISRVPPGMTPQKVRHLMARWGEVGKVYAQRKDAPTGFNPQHQQNHKKQRHQAANFSEAWVEFLDKNVAKTVARMLNAEVIGGKKGDRWRDDIWTMKYLSGFRWEMLGEQVAYERQAHQARLRNEIARSRTEQSEYLRNVEVARVLRKREAKRAEQAGQAGATGTTEVPSKTGAAATGAADSSRSQPAKERYKQRSKASHQGLEAKGMETVLSSVFG